MKPCDECDGTGKVNGKLCKVCHGTCVVKDDDPVDNWDIPDFMKDIFRGKV
jgi:DnaJ-class molecular chaperone